MLPNLLSSLPRRQQWIFPKAKWKLGLYYEGKGNVVERDYNKVCKLYTESAEAGVVEAQRFWDDFICNSENSKKAVDGCVMLSLLEMTKRKIF